MQNFVFWNITLWIPIKINRRFGGTYLLHLQGGRVSHWRNNHETNSRLCMLHLWLNLWFCYKCSEYRSRRPPRDIDRTSVTRLAFARVRDHNFLSSLLGGPYTYESGSRVQLGSGSNEPNSSVCWSPCSYVCGEINPSPAPRRARLVRV
jgi:hypothetical protein